VVEAAVLLPEQAHQAHQAHQAVELVEAVESGAGKEVNINTLVELNL
jgi:hypothetical protein